MMRLVERGSALRKTRVTAGESAHDTEDQRHAEPGKQEPRGNSHPLGSYPKRRMLVPEALSVQHVHSPGSARPDNTYYR